jgi:hypothetical protein
LGWSNDRHVTAKTKGAQSMKEEKRKFKIGEQIRNTRTCETGLITAYDLSREVYSIKKNNGGYALWGELEMEKGERE